MTTTDSQPARRSVPTVSFTDAEAGAQTFAGSEDRMFKYFTPRRRKASQYEDVTVEVQPDPRHYLSQGWLYAFADGSAGFPMEWTRLKAWGQDKHPTPRRTPGSGGAGYPWPATGWHEFRDPNEEWELTLYRYNAEVVRQMTRNLEVARQTKAFERWGVNWIRFVEQHVGAWMHVEHGLGMYVFIDAQRAAPTNMHNNAISVNAMHKMRFAQDLALYNLALSDDIAEFDGRAHLETWSKDMAWQGVRECVERLTAIDDWAEAVFSTNVVFEPLVGELFRSRLVMQASSPNGDFATPTLVGAGEYDYAQRDLRYTKAMFELLSNDREFGAENRAVMSEWVSTWVPRCLYAARTLQPLWSQPDGKPVRFEDSLDASKARFVEILGGLGLQPPKELAL
jgi:propane monooxygenase small subunit